MSELGFQSDAEAVGLLTDPVRRRVYTCLKQHAQAPVTREQIASEAGISRTLAAYHLDKLSDAGLADIDYARTNGRVGPGAGRPAKRYTWRGRDVSASFPPRNYGLLAQILASAVDTNTDGTVRAAIATAATAQGAALSARSGSVLGALTIGGYEPEVDEDDTIVLHNCPFHSVVQEHTELVCDLNRAFVQGTLQGVGSDPNLAQLSPCEGRCCVIVRGGAANVESS